MTRANGDLDPQPRALLLAALLAISGAVGASGDYASGFQNITTNIPTPHVDWLSAPANRDVNALFFVRRDFGRDVVELVQRWPIAYQVTTYGSWHNDYKLGMSDHLAWYKSAGHPETSEKTVSHTLARFTHMLAGNPDVLVLDCKTYTAVDDATRSNIWNHVEHGGGLFCPMPEKDFMKEVGRRVRKGDELKPSRHSPSLPGLVVRRFRIGKGRVAVVSSYPKGFSIRLLCPLGKDERTDELTLAEQIKAMRWASGVEPTVQVADVSVPDHMAWQAKSPGQATFRAESLREAGVHADVTVFDEAWTVIGKASEPFTFKPGASEQTVALPPLPAGTHTLALQIRADGGVVDFETCPLTVVADTTCNVSPVGQPIPVNDPVRLSVTISNSVPGDTVTVSLTDAWDRLVGSKTFDAVNGTQDVTIESPSPKSRYQDALVELKRNGMALCRARTQVFRLIHPDTLEFRHGCWHSCSPGSRVDQRIRYMRTLGLNLGFSAGCSAEIAADTFSRNLDPFTMTLTSVRRHDKDNQIVDLTGETFYTNNLATFLTAVKGSRQYGEQWGYNHGDEIYMATWRSEKRSVTNAAAHAAFVSYLEKDYGDIAALNEAWGTGFATFDTIEVPENIDVPAEPRAPWLDYTRFLSDVFCGYHEKLNNAVREAYPGVRIAMEGIEQFSCFDGIEWRRLNACHDGIVVYPHEDHDNKLYSWRSGIDFMAPNGMGGYWMSYGSDIVPEVAAGYPWRALFNGLGAIFYFEAYNDACYYAALYPDWRPRPAYAAMTREIRRIQDGVDRLVAGAERQYSRVAVHYSQRSWALSFPSAQVETHVNQLGTMNHSRYFRSGYGGHVANNASGFISLLMDLGYQPRMVATEQIEDGALKDYDILVLPFSQSLTDDEVAAIRRFVERGGMLLADYGTGVRDERGNLRKDGGGSLDEVFGISQAPGPVTMQRVMISDAFSRGQDELVWGYAELDEVLVAPPVRMRNPEVGEVNAMNLKGIDHGNAQDGTPVCLVNHFGDGVAVYLNFSMETYLRMRVEGTARLLQRMMYQFVSHFGRVPLPVFITGTADGYDDYRATRVAPVYGVEINRFADGAAEYVGLAWTWKRHDWEPKEVMATFITPSYLYDALNGTCLGYTDHAVFEVEGGSPVKLFARMPYAVTGLTAEPSSDALTRGETLGVQLAVQTNGEAPVGRHVIRAEVHAPSGREIMAARDVIVMPEGKGGFHYTPALDAEPGVYRLVFRDTATGVTKHVDMSLR